MCILMSILLFKAQATEATHFIFKKYFDSRWYLCVYVCDMCLYAFYVCVCVCVCLRVCALLYLQQVYIAGATRALQTEGPCLRHASQAEQESKLEGMGVRGDSQSWGIAHITNAQGGLQELQPWSVGKGLCWVKCQFAIWTQKDCKNVRKAT